MFPRLLHRGKPTVLESGDIIELINGTRTVRFYRNGERMHIQQNLVSDDAWTLSGNVLSLLETISLCTGFKPTRITEEKPGVTRWELY